MQVGTLDDEFFQTLIRIGCCRRCILRYIGIPQALLCFEDPHTSLINFGYISELEPPPSKRFKDNACIACLDILTDEVLNEMLEHQSLNGLADYDCGSFGLSIIYPIACNLRDHGVRVYLRKRFPDRFKNDNTYMLNFAFRHAIEARLSKKIRKVYQSTAILLLRFSTSYKFEDDELKHLQSHFEEPLSRRRVLRILNTISDEEFEKIVGFPLTIPSESATFTDLKIDGRALYINGKFCKYKPGEVRIEYLLTKAVHEVLGECQFKLHAETFLYPNYRILGKGSIFFIQFEDPKLVEITLSECEEIRNIDLGPDIKITSIVPSNRALNRVVLESENYATRRVKLLCKVFNSTDLDQAVRWINSYTIIDVTQKTPLRFLHSRGLTEKRRRIFHIRARKRTDNLIELDLVVESGLQLPEFVSGDFGRTEPSLAGIIQEEVDVITIDFLDQGQLSK